MMSPLTGEQGCCINRANVIWALVAAAAMVGCRESAEAWQLRMAASRSHASQGRSESRNAILPDSAAALRDDSIDSRMAHAIGDVAQLAESRRLRPAAFITTGRFRELEELRPTQQPEDRPEICWGSPLTDSLSEPGAMLVPLPAVGELAPESQALGGLSSLTNETAEPTTGPTQLTPRLIDLAAKTAHNRAPSLDSLVDAAETEVDASRDAERITRHGDNRVESPTRQQSSSPQAPEIAKSQAPTSRPNAAPADPSADIQALLAQSTPAATGAPTGDRVNSEAMQKLHRSNELAARGAYYAARNELIAVLQKIATAKDAIHGSVRCSEALTTGMRALDEAADFVAMPGRAGGLDQVSATAAAHATPLGKRGALSGLAPWQASDVYLRYAQLNLGAAVAGEPAGSMALHALGKLYSRLAAVEDNGDVLAHRRAFACQQAALLARNDNYMAAHELGVLLAESGHYQDAEFVLRQVAEQRTDRVVLQNLARVNRMLGQSEMAALLEQHANVLAGSSAENGSVRIVSPAAFAESGDNGRAAASVAARPQPPVAASPETGSAVPAATGATPWYLK